MAHDTAQDFCLAVLRSGELADKLCSPRDGDGRLLPLGPDDGFDVGDLAEPARHGALRLRPGGERLPPLGALGAREARVACLERFAHHELQAIELFAWALLRFPRLPPPLRRGFLLVLEEEQRHLQLYLGRLADLGARFGDGGLSDYLWQHRPRIESAADPPLAFLCALGLTFEQANLDFALLYRDAFRQAGDHDTAAVLQQVHDDEIRHVRLAVRWLRRLKQPGESDLGAYLRAVPFPLSAARAKGRRFDAASRRRAGMDDDFIAHVARAEPYRRSEPPVAAEQRLWLLPNLGAEEAAPVPTGARGFLGGLYGAWSALFDGAAGLPWLLPPGDSASGEAWRQALGVAPDGAALPCLESLSRPGSLVAWLNTPEAAESAAAHRLTLLGPPPSVVRVVHDKAFAVASAESLGLRPPCLDGLSLILSAEECRDPAAATRQLGAHVARWPDWTGRRFVLKPRLGTSGRGRTFGRLGATGRLEPPPPARAWALLAGRGGCVVEPWLDRLADLSVQLMIRPDGVELLGETTQLVTPSGQILGNRGLLDAAGRLRADSDGRWEQPLAAAATRLGQAAAAAGFHGIAGVDALVFRGPDGGPLLRPIVELNGRFTTGTVALGLVRRLQQAGRIAPGRETAWALLLKAPGRPTPDDAAVTWVCPLSRGPALVYGEPARLEQFLASLSS